MIHRTGPQTQRSHKRGAMLTDEQARAVRRLLAREGQVRAHAALRTTTYMLDKLLSPGALGVTTAARDRIVERLAALEGVGA